jgi:hypothetical protein
MRGPGNLRSVLNAHARTEGRRVALQHDNASLFSTELGSYVAGVKCAAGAELP